MFRGPRVIKRFIIAFILLGLVGGALIGLNLLRDRLISHVFANFPEAVTPVTTVTVAPVDWQPELGAIGTVNAAQGVDLTVEGAGIVRAVSFAANEKVEVGQVLLELDDQTQAADLESARTQLQLAQTNLDRARRLQARGVTAEANLETTEANFRAAEAQVARAGAVMDTRRLVAPFSGTIGLPRIDAGSYISPGTIVATLQDLERMRVDFSLPEQDLPELHIGQPITAQLDGGGTLFHGRITGIDPRVDSASRMLSLRGELEAVEGALTPGQFVRVAVALPQEDGIIALPQTAVMSSLYGDYVYVVRERAPAPPAAPVDEGSKDILDRIVEWAMARQAQSAAAEGEGDGEAAAAPAADEPVLEVRQVFVQVGRRSGGMVEISGDAIKAGDQVVSSGQNRLSNGGRVTINNTVTPDGQGETPPTDSEAATGTGAGTDAAAADGATTASAVTPAAPDASATRDDAAADAQTDTDTQTGAASQ